MPAFIECLDMLKSKVHILPRICTLCACFYFAIPTLAGPIAHWNATTGNWSAASNWSELSTPTSGTTTQIYFNVAPGILTATSSNNNISGTFNLNQLNFGGTGNFALTGNALRFNGTSPTLNNTNNTGVISIANNLVLNASTTFTGNTNSQLSLNGVISGANPLTINGGTTTFNNVNNSFSGGLNITSGTAKIDQTSTSITLNNIGNNSYFGQGAINASGGNIVIQNTTSGADVTINRSMSFTSATATGANTNLIQAADVLTLSSGRTFSLDNGSQLTLRSLSGTILMDNATFNFGTNGGIVTIQGNLYPVATAQNLIVNSTNGNAIIQYSGKDPGNAWNDGSSFDIDINNGRLSGSGNLLLDITGGAVVQYKQVNFGGKLIFQGVSGGNASATSTDTTVGRIAFGDAATTAAQSFTISQGLFFRNYNQVTGYLPQSGSSYLGSNTIASNITIENGETAFAGTETGNASGSGRFPSRLQIGSNASNTFTINNGAVGTLDLSFFTDPTLGLAVNGVTLNSTTTIQAGGMLQFKRSANLAGATYDALVINGPIIGQGNEIVGQGEAIVNIQNSVSTGSTLIFNNSVNLFVQGQDCNGIRVQGSQANVDAFLTSSFLRTHVLSVPGSSSDQGTLTIAYNNTSFGSTPARIFTNADAPVAPSYIRLGFDSQGGNSPIVALNATGGVSGSALSNWNGLVIKGNATVRLLSDVNFIGASSASNTTFCLEGGTLQLNDGAASPTLHSVKFTGNGELEAGTIAGGGPTTGGILIIAGDAIKTTTSTVYLNGRIMASGGGPAGTGKGLQITAGTISQGINNAIIGGTNMTLSGGTYATNSHNQDAGLLGTLTLTATSYIDFGASSTSKIYFANSSGTSGSWTPTGDLILLNWNGTPIVGGGNTQIYFGNNNSGLTNSQLARIWFSNPTGFAPGFYQGILLSTGELVPVPEFSTYMGAIALIIFTLGYECKRRRKVHLTIV